MRRPGSAVARLLGLGRRDGTRIMSLLLSVVLAVAAVVHTSTPVDALTPGTGQFIVTCRYSHSRAADPIVSPGVYPSAHFHDFFGNTTTDEHSTVRSLADGQSLCGVSRDLSAYWLPAVYAADGTRVLPSFVRNYYRAEAGVRVRPFPRGARLIGGDAHATAPQDAVRFHCGQNGTHLSPRRAIPYDCTPYLDPADERYVPGSIGVVIEVYLPACWDGIRTVPSGFTYGAPGPEAQTTCPPDHAIAIPSLSPRFHTGLVNGVGMMLSSGPASTGHADFFNGWRHARLASLVTTCLNAHVNCGPLGDRKSLRVRAWRTFGSARANNGALG